MAAAAAAASTSLLSKTLRYRFCPRIGHGSKAHHHVNFHYRRRFHPLLKASSQGVPEELTEESKFVPLTAEEPVYGPPALLLLGFEREETPKLQQLLKELDGEFLKIIHCTQEMLSVSVWEAMHTQQTGLEAVRIAESLPRMCILSGLSGEEMMMFIDAFPEIGLDPAVFAALVPNSANKHLGEVVEEIMGDHEMVSARQQSG